MSATIRPDGNESRCKEQAMRGTLMKVSLRQFSGLVLHLPGSQLEGFLSANGQWVFFFLDMWHIASGVPPSNEG